MSKAARRTRRKRVAQVVENRGFDVAEFYFKHLSRPYVPGEPVSLTWADYCREAGISTDSSAGFVPGRSYTPKGLTSNGES